MHRPLPVTVLLAVNQVHTVLLQGSLATQYFVQYAFLVRPGTLAATEGRCRTAITLTIASFMVTVASFALTMIGMKKVANAVSRVSAGVHQRVRVSSAHASRRDSAAGARGSRPGDSAKDPISVAVS